MSSFELESISTFKPRIAILLNIKEAHLDHHKTMENYINAKANITKNQEKSDFLIYNVDDLNVKEVSNKSHAIKIGISLHNEKAEAYYKEGMMYSKYGNVSFEKTFSDFYNLASIFHACTRQSEAPCHDGRSYGTSTKQFR